MLQEKCGNPGRGNHQIARTAYQAAEEARLLCAKLIHAETPRNIIFTLNTTYALNFALQGGLQKGDHVITSSLEHNSVTRVLHELLKQGVEVTKIPTDLNCGINSDELCKAVKPNTKMFVCTHISNVTGTLNDLERLGTVCQAKDLIFLVDAAQSIGSQHIDVQKMNIDLLAFPGHKSLLGLQGVGGLYIRQGIELKPILYGSTGSRSETLEQPKTRPDKYESGTTNTPGLAGLAAGVRFILEKGIDNIILEERLLLQKLIYGLMNIEGVKLLGPDLNYPRGNVVSIQIANREPAEIALILDSSFNIAVRSGLHCAADAHYQLGTLNNGGTIRLSFNFMNHESEIDTCLQALAEIIHKG